MGKYILKRLLMLIPVILGVSLVVFLIVSMTPGDAALIILPYGTEEQLNEIRESLGLNRPLLVQYGSYVLNMLRGNLGNSYYSNAPVLAAFLERLPSTALLAFSSMLISLIIAIPLGVYSATHQYSGLDRVGNVVALIGNSMPNFWIGLLLIMLFSLKLRWLPSGGNRDGLRSLILPAATLGIRHVALIYRMTRSSMLDVVRSDYIRTARSKGLKERVVIYKHALKNALIPVITTIGLQVRVIFGGSLMIEQVFNIAGIGSLITIAIQGRDYMVIQGCVLIISVFVVIVNLIIDLLYGFVDPRIRKSWR